MNDSFDGSSLLGNCNCSWRRRSSLTESAAGPLQSAAYQGSELERLSLSSEKSAAVGKRLLQIAHQECNAVDAIVWMTRMKLSTRSYNCPLRSAK